MSAAGIQILINANWRLPPPYDQVWLGGLDDPTAGQPDAATTFAGADGVRLVLMHSPEGLEPLGQERFELALCGHTHGGQIGWPPGQPIWVPPGRWNRRYPFGRHQLDQPPATLMVSRGVGYGGLPIRLFAPAEVLALTIRWNEHGVAPPFSRARSRRACDRGCPHYSSSAGHVPSRQSRQHHWQALPGNTSFLHSKGEATHRNGNGDK